MITFLLQELRKSIVYILLIFHVFFTGNVYVFFGSIATTQALTSTWDFTTPSDYILSDDSLSSVQRWIVDLDLRLTQTWVISRDDGNNIFLDTPRRVAVSWDYAYVSAYTPDRIQVLNISDPTNPIAVTNLQNNNGTLMLNGPMALEISGDYLYISEYIWDAIQVLDISNPAAPVAAGNYPNNGTVRLNGPRWLDIQWNLLYVASWVDDAIQIFDITDPTNLVPVGQLDTANGRLNGARDIIVEWIYAYVSARNNDSIQILNISDPTTPTFVWEIVHNNTDVFLDSVFAIDKQWDYIYATGYNNDRIQVIDVSDPTTPTAVTSLSNTDLPGLNGPRSIYADGDFLFIGDYLGDSVMVVDISAPENPIRESDITNSVATNLNGSSLWMVRIWNLIYLGSYPDDDFVILESGYSDTSPIVTPTTAFNYGAEELTTFTENLWTGNEWTPTYQISRNNGTDWYFWNGTTWQLTTNGVIDSTNATIINANIDSFNDVGSGNEFLWRAYLASDGTQKVEIDDITVISTVPPPPAPGGIDTNLELWLKADVGTSTTTDGAAVTTWADQSGNWLDATAVVTPDYRNNDADSVNFNPVIEFNWVDDYMRNIAGGGFSDTYFLVMVPNNTIEGTASQWVPFWWDCLSGTLSSGACGLSFAGVALGAFTAAFPDEVITHALGSSLNWRSAQTAIATYEAGKPLFLGINESITADGSDIFANAVQVNNASANTYQTLSNADYYIWRSGDNTFPFYFSGRFAEVINYSGRVSDTDRQKIESYFWIKYWVTLQEWTKNYVASDDSIFWNSSSAGVYVNNVVGIGRDNDQQLGQVKSKSINSDAIVTIEADGEGTNIANSFIDIEDKEFFMLSNNNKGNTWIVGDAPTWFNILERKWRTQEAGDIGNITLDFDVADSDFDIPVLNAGSNYYIIYDTDGDDDLSDEAPITLINTSGDIWRVSGINPESERVFTLATEASSNNIPTDIWLTPQDIDENNTPWVAIGTLSTTDADPWDTHTYTLVSGAGGEDNEFFSITWDALSLIHSSDHEIRNDYSIKIQTNDGNGGTFQEIFAININDLTEAVSSSLDFESPLDDYKYTVTSGDWSRTTTNPFEWVFSIESDNGWVGWTQSCFVVNHTHSGTGSVDFYYNVSSQAGGDFFRFFVDDIQQLEQSGTIAYTQYVQNDIPAWLHEYKWCYIKDGTVNTGTDNTFIDLITFPSSGVDIIPPEITSINFASGSLLPGWDHYITIDYNDVDSGIDTSSASITLQKWDGVSAFWSDMSGISLDTWATEITTTGALYLTQDLSFGRYIYNFTIDDNVGNTSSTWAEFYIDQPEFIIGSGSIDIGDIHSVNETFSGDVPITIRTVGAGFDITMNNSTDLSYLTETIGWWNGTTGYWFDQDPFSGTISPTSTGTVIWSEVQNINTNGEKNTYIYNIRFWALVDPEQVAGEYEWTIDFDIDFTY